MSSFDQLRALMTKNFILMRRNLCTSLCEVLFPIILMLLLALLRSYYRPEAMNITVNDTDFLVSNLHPFTALDYSSQNLSINSSFYNFSNSNGKLYYSS